MSTGEDVSAAAHSGLKRQREREMADKRQEKRVEDVLRHTTHLVDAIAGINTNYVRTLSEEQLNLSHRVAALQSLQTTAQLRTSEMTTQVVRSNLKALRGTVTNAVKDRFVDALRAEVDRGQSEVLDALAAHVDTALQGSLTVADTQLTAERKLSASLVEQLRAYAHTLLESTKTANQRAFSAEVDAMQKDVLLAKLRATQLFDQNRLMRHEQEVDALMRVVAQLAERSHSAEAARAELQKAKRHVRWLEQYLDLNHIVAAAQPENFLKPISSPAREGGPSGASPAPPNDELRRTAPHYFALKMLQHKDVTLTELVDSWQGQEARIQAAEQRYTQLQAVVEQVQHDALVVHQRYLEEKQRREIADRRMTDMVRERLYPQTDASVFQEVQRLRWAYTEVVDDAAQLAVNLKVCRDELQAAQEENRRLSSQVRQLQRDAETDQVALTIQELRSEYAERVRAMEAAATRTQLQLALAQQLSRQYGSVADEATAALQDVAQANVALAEVPPPQPPQSTAAAAAASGPHSRPSWQQEAQRVEAQAEKLVALTASIKEFGLAHGELYEAQMEKLMEQWTRTRSEVAAARAPADLAHAKESDAPRLVTEHTRDTVSSSAASTLVSSTHLSTESAHKSESVVQSSKMALREALLLLVASLQSTDVERANLLDASLSDAQYVTELMREISAVTSERDRLRAQVKTCRELLEKNHVTVVERALMHDVPVEDSLNVAEAAERITVLRDQLTAAKQLCDRALGEVKQVTGEKEEAEARLEELTKAHQVLQGHAKRLADKLKASLEKEGQLMEEAVALQDQIAHLVQAPLDSVTTNSASRTNEEEGAETAETISEIAKEGDGGATGPSAPVPTATTTPNQLSDLFATLSATLQQLDEEVCTLHASRAEAAADGAAASSESHGNATLDTTHNDAALLESLSRSGMMSVVLVLKETLQKAGLLKASLQHATGAQAAALCAAAAASSSSSGASTATSGQMDGAENSTCVPQPSAEVQRQAHAYAVAQLEAKLAQYKAERQQMQERMLRAEQKTGEMEAANQRLLAISKSVLEKQSLLKKENDSLREQVRQLAAPPAPEPEAPAVPLPVVEEALPESSSLVVDVPPQMPAAVSVNEEASPVPETTTEQISSQMPSNQHALPLPATQPPQPMPEEVSKAPVAESVVTEETPAGAENGEEMTPQEDVEPAPENEEAMVDDAVADTSVEEKRSEVNSDLPAEEEEASS